MKIKAIGFDWGGVLFGQPGDTFSQGVSGVLGVDTQEYKDAHFKHNALVNIESYSYEKYWKVLLKELKREDKFDEIIKYLKNLAPSKLNNDMFGLVKKLKQNGYKLGLLSNTTLIGGKRIKESEIAKYFDTVVISAEIGFMKPQKQAFSFLLSVLGIKPIELVFIDDTERSLSSAKEIGYHPVLFKDYKSLVRELKQFGVKTS